MIKKSPFTTNLSEISASPSTYNEIEDGIRETDYSDQRAYGFVPKDIDEGIAAAHLVIKRTTTVTDFNESTQEIESREESHRRLIPFRIDFENEFLEVFSNKDDTKTVITRLADIAGWDIEINSLSLDITSFYKQIKNSDEYSTKVSSLRINDFSLNDNTRGTCHLKVFEEKEAIRLLDKYQDEISFVTVEFRINDDSISIGIYDSGSIRFYSKTDDDEQLLEFLKEMLNKSMERKN